MISDQHDFEPPKAITALAGLAAAVLALGLFIGMALRAKGWM
jgi:hypothetical protein